MILKGKNRCLGHVWEIQVIQGSWYIGSSVYCRLEWWPNISLIVHRNLKLDMFYYNYEELL